MAKVNLKKTEHFDSYFLDENGEFDPTQWQTGVFIQHERICTFHMSQEEFAEAFGITVEDLSSWERCVGAPPQSFIDMIYDVKSSRKELPNKKEEDNLPKSSDTQAVLLSEILSKLNNIEQILNKSL